MLPMDVPGCHILAIQPTEQGLLLIAKSDTNNHACPDCGHVSVHPHSGGSRQLRDLPVQGRCVRLLVFARRWRCLNQGCRRKTFTERLDGLAGRYARRTERMTETLQRLILAVSSTIGAAVAQHMGIKVSARTLLRVVSHSEGQAPTPRVLGVDDFALARGRTYGTLLCDLETGRPIDVLMGRTKQPLLEWLKSHPGVEIIVRDRASSYAEAARAGAPEALQVADRFHLVRNVSDALKEVVDRQSWALPEPSPLPVSASPQEPAPAPAPVSEGEMAPDCPPPTRRMTRAEQQRAAAAGRLQRRYEEVHRLRTAGRSIRQIRKMTGLSRATIDKYLAASAVPKRAERRRVPSKLDPFVDYLGERWRSGIRNSNTLHDEIVQQGYSGSKSLLRRLLAPWRAAGPPPHRETSSLHPLRNEIGQPEVAWKTLRWAVLCPPEHLTCTLRSSLLDFLALHPALNKAHELVQRFRGLLADKNTAAFTTWLVDAAQSKLAPFERLARTMEADSAAVCAGIELPWSTGPVEGHITRVKLMKRIGYGRAGLPLLRARIIGYAGGGNRPPARTA